MLVTFTVWMIMEKREILDKIKVPLQSVMQTTRFSCGNAALRSIFQYYGVGPEEEQKFIDMMDSSYRKGTMPSRIVQMARKYGLCVKQRHHLTLAKLKKILDQERPVICPVQAYGSQRGYAKSKHGHYIVAIGYDDENIYFEDPLLKGKRGYMPNKEFDERWHDKDAEGNVFDHYGIVIWKKDGDGQNASYHTRATKID